MTTLRLDLHTHPKAAKRTPFQTDAPLAYARTALNRGLHGVALTEHFHANNFWGVYDHLRARWPYARGRFLVEGALFYAGAELTLRERVDVLLLAPLDELRRIDEAFERPLSDGYQPSAPEFADALASIGSCAALIGAHPMRPDKRADTLGRTMIERLFHALEINACYAGDHDEHIAFEAERLGLALTGGSDAHASCGVGAAWTELDVRGDSFDDVRDAIAARRTAVRVHDDAESICEAARVEKGRLKAALPRLPRVETTGASGVVTSPAAAGASRHAPIAV